jgi:uncharacterized membrane protein HdeD (DUF308 family)
MNSPRLREKYLAGFRENWGWFLVGGIVLILLGIIALGAITFTTYFTVIFLGCLLIAGGVVVIIDAFVFFWEKWGDFFLNVIFGVLYLIVGFSVIQYPASAMVSLTLLLGIFYVVLGIFRMVFSLGMVSPIFGWSFLNGIISLAIGILILISWPKSSLYIIGIFVGVDLLATGFTYLIASLLAKTVPKVP